MGTQGLSDEQKAAAAVVQDIYAAFSEGDPDRIESHQVPQCTVWDAFIPPLINGVAERKKFHQNDQDLAAKRGALTVDVEPLNVHLLGDVAVVLSMMSFEYQPPNPIQRRVRLTSVLKKTGSAWQMFHHHEGVEPEGWPSLEEQ